MAPTRRRRTPASDNLLVFDGDCAFCTSTVEQLRGILPVMPPAKPWQHIDLDAHGLSREEASSRVWLLTPDHQYGGHLALAALLRHQEPFAMRLLGWILITPIFSPFAALKYSLIARYRHLLPGGTPACALPR